MSEGEMKVGGEVSWVCYESGGVQSWSACLKVMVWELEVILIVY